MTTLPGKAALFATLPPVPKEELAPRIRHAAARAQLKLVVLDDDPTGTQTVYDVPVLTRWTPEILAAEFANDLACFYLLTNSRALSASAARALNREIAQNLQHAARVSGRRFVVVSRSDSTLRGHYPAETDELARELGPFHATVVFPYFEAGGRYTIDDIHYVAEGDALVPAAETPFARDAVFGYRHSNLRDYVAEKTAGRVAPDEVHSISLGELRSQASDPAAAVAQRLRNFSPGSVVIVNAAHPRDAECFALASILAEQTGTRLLYRTAAQFVAARLALEPRALWRPSHRATSGHGGLVIVGSHVPKTTAQLHALLQAGGVHALTLDVQRLRQPHDRTTLLAHTAREIETRLARGETVVVATSRELVTGTNEAAALAIGRQVSEALIELVRGLRAPPAFLVAKGGITSSDIATRGLGVERAIVRGQILPGVPVWELGPEAKFPGLPYVVFPGNVGGPEALRDAVQRLQSA